jgi:Fe2+ or Zn2+ uptake regulation protein
MSSRKSRQREVVLAAVRSTIDHPTADWVYRQARRTLPRIGLGTLYRNNLKTLAESVFASSESRPGVSI